MGEGQVGQPQQTTRSRLRRKSPRNHSRREQEAATLRQQPQGVRQLVEHATPGRPADTTSQSRAARENSDRRMPPSSTCSDSEHTALKARKCSQQSHCRGRVRRQMPPAGGGALTRPPHKHRPSTSNSASRDPQSADPQGVAAGLCSGSEGAAPPSTTIVTEEEAITSLIHNGAKCLGTTQGCTC